jgi:hypothetical protein
MLLEHTAYVHGAIIRMDVHYTLDTRLYEVPLNSVDLTQHPSVSQNLGFNPFRALRDLCSPILRL